MRDTSAVMTDAVMPGCSPGARALLLLLQREDGTRSALFLRASFRVQTEPQCSGQLLAGFSVVILIESFLGFVRALKPEQPRFLGLKERCEKELVRACRRKRAPDRLRRHRGCDACFQRRFHHTSIYSSTVGYFCPPSGQHFSREGCRTVGNCSVGRLV